MGWNYRVIRHADTLPDGSPVEWFAIHDVFYEEDNDDHPRSVGVTPSHIRGETVEELIDDLARFKRATEKDALDYDSFTDEGDK